jgi:transcriptional regulator with XRE-family HTH domain
MLIGYGERLKKLRLDSKQTMDTVSKAMGIAKSTYAGYESEFRQPSLDKLAFFADYFNVTTDYLLGLTSEQNKIKTKFALEHYKDFKDFHWDGIPLNEKELKEVSDFLRGVVEKKQRQNVKEYKL